MKKKEGILFKTPCWYIYYSDSQMGANTSMYSKSKRRKEGKGGAEAFEKNVGSFPYYLCRHCVHIPTQLARETIQKSTVRSAP